MDVVISECPAMFDSPRLHRESSTVAAMIRIYCRAHDHERSEGPTCPTCQTLSDYALERLRRCPFGEGKTTCVQCPVHCYQPARREQVRQVMRFAGPRMLARHPILTIFHWLDSRRHEPLEARSN